MNEVATPPGPGAVTPRWGIPDAILGWFVVYLGSAIWAITVLAATGHTGEELDDMPLGVVAFAQVGLSLGFFLVPWVVTRVKGNGIVADLGLRVTWSDVWQGGLLGIVAQIVLIPLLYWPILELLDKGVDDLEGPAQALTDRANSPLDVVLLVLIVGVMAPLFEEIFYRGLLQRSLLKRGLGPVVSVGLTALLFAGTHFQLLQLPGLFLAGVLFGTLAYRSGRLGPAVAAHLTFNMVTVISLLAVS